MSGPRKNLPPSMDYLHLTSFKCVLTPAQVALGLTFFYYDSSDSLVIAGPFTAVDIEAGILQMQREVCGAGATLAYPNEQAYKVDIVDGLLYGFELYEWNVINWMTWPTFLGTAVGVRPSRPYILLPAINGNIETMIFKQWGYEPGLFDTGNPI